jgi:serine/threonine protein kinase
LRLQNILIARGPPHWWIKLADFGFTKQKEENKKYNTVVGRLDYQAPEIVLRLKSNNKVACEYDKLVDIWSSGCVIFRLLTSETPFKEDQLKSYYDGTMQFPAEKLVPSVGEDYISLLNGMLKAKPEHRWTAEQALKTPLLKHVGE